MPGTPVEILLVEDSPADVELTRQGLLQGKIANNLHVVEHGGKAISFLHREGEFSDAPRPDLILLDVNMPQVDGIQVLKHIKRHPQLCNIPVVVLSSLAEPETIKQTYHLQVNAYMTKPVSFQQFVELVQDLSDYWFAMVKLPAPAEQRLSQSLIPATTEVG